MQSVFTGPVYVVRDNIDTDQIIPAQREAAELFVFVGDGGDEVQVLGRDDLVRVDVIAHDIEGAFEHRFRHGRKSGGRRAAFQSSNWQQEPRIPRFSPGGRTAEMVEQHFKLDPLNFPQKQFLPVA